jgi:hypothetical protein
LQSELHVAINPVLGEEVFVNHGRPTGKIFPPLFAVIQYFAICAAIEGSMEIGK